MSAFAIVLLVLHCAAWIVSWIILAKWLHLNKREELGNSTVVELMYGFMLAFAWPASITLMLLNDSRCNADKIQ